MLSSSVLCNPCFGFPIMVDSANNDTAWAYKGEDTAVFTSIYLFFFPVLIQHALPAGKTTVVDTDAS